MDSGEHFTWGMRDKTSRKKKNSLNDNPQHECLLKAKHDDPEQKDEAKLDDLEQNDEAQSCPSCRACACSRN